MPTPPAAGVPAAIRLSSLTSLRWLAASVVFLRHTGIAPRIGAQGATGVSFFFILSGFVLAWSAQGRSTGEFLRRRVARIYPSYAALTLIALPVLVAVDTIAVPGGVLRGLFTLTLLQSWIPLERFYFAGNGVSWSLANEAFFYVLFPALTVVTAAAAGLRASAHALWLLLAGLVVLGIAVPLILHPDLEIGFRFWFIYINPAFRAVEFLIGMCLAELLKRGAVPRLPFVPIAVLTAAAYLVAGVVPLYAMWSATTLIPFCLLIVAAAQADQAGATPRPLGSRPMLLLGAWSYAFYLLHTVVIAFARGTISRLGVEVPWPPVALACYLIGIALAALVYRGIEQPAERWIRTGGRSAAQPDGSQTAVP